MDPLDTPPLLPPPRTPLLDPILAPGLPGPKLPLPPTVDPLLSRSKDSLPSSTLPRFRRPPPFDQQLNASELDPALRTTTELTSLISRFLPLSVAVLGERRFDRLWIGSEEGLEEASGVDARTRSSLSRTRTTSRSSPPQFVVRPSEPPIHLSIPSLKMRSVDRKSLRRRRKSCP